MIQITDNTTAVTVYIPRISVINPHTYTLYLKRGNRTITLVSINSDEGLEDYRKITFDFTNVDNGEYEYKLNTGESGLIRVGKIATPITSYTYNEEYTYYIGDNQKPAPHTISTIRYTTSDSEVVVLNREPFDVDVLRNEYSDINGLITLDGVVTRFNKNAFSDSHLASIFIPTSVTFIDDWAFADTKLVETYMPQSVEYIGHMNFNSNDGEITSGIIYYSGTMAQFKAIDKENDWFVSGIEGTDISFELFVQCSDGTLHYGSVIRYTTNNGQPIEPDEDAFDAVMLSNEYSYGNGRISFSDSLTTIGNGAFEDCSNLSSITIPDNVISIGNYAFWSSEVKNVTLPASIRYIGDKNFCYVIGEETWTCDIYYNGTMTQFDAIDKELNWFNNDPDLEDDYTWYVNVHCSDGVLNYENYYIWYKTTDDIKLTPNSTTGFGAVYIGSDWYRSYRFGGLFFDRKITAIGAGAFSGCRTLSAIEVFDAKTIGDRAFYNTHLSRVDMTTGTTYIGHLNFVCPAGESDWHCDINFGGTTEEFEAIEKESDWYDSNNNQVNVICTNGTLHY